MTSSPPGGPWGPQNYDALIRQADARLTAQPQGADEFTAPAPASSFPPAGDAGYPGPALPAPMKSGPRRHDRVAASALPDVDVRQRTRGQGLSWASVLLVVGAAVLLGVAVHHAIDGLLTSLSTFSDWLTVALVALGVGVCGVICAVIAVFRARPRMVATLGMVLGLTLPALALAIGAKSGWDTLIEQARAAAVDVVPVVVRALESLGVDPALIEPLMRWLFR